MQNQGISGPVTYWLLDYAAVQPGPSRSESSLFPNLIRMAPAAADKLPTTSGCSAGYGYWGFGAGVRNFNPPPSTSSGYTGFRGVIVRSSYLVRNGQPSQLGYDPAVTMGQITDGTSKTMIVMEKRLRTGGDTSVHPQDDDEGWASGWDYDTVRLTYCTPHRDSPAMVTGTNATFMTPGSAHDAGFNAVFADGSVRNFSYEIDIETLNRLGHRRDGESVDLSR